MTKKITIKIADCLHCAIWETIKAYNNVHELDADDVLDALAQVIADAIVMSESHGLDVHKNVLALVDDHVAERKKEQSLQPHTTVQ